MKNHLPATARQNNSFYPPAHQLRRLFDRSPDLICSIDAQGRFLHVNKAALHLWGYAPEELVGKQLIEFVAEEDRQKAADITGRLTREQTETSFQIRCRRRNGVVLPMTWFAGWDAGEKLLFCRAEAAPEEEAKEDLQARYGQKVKQQYKELHDILARITDGFFSMDAEWRITFINPQVERMLDINREDYLSRNYWECFPQMVGSVYYEQYQKAMRENLPVHFEAYFAPFGKWLSVNAYPSKTGLSVFFHDVSERRKQEEELRVSHERFRLAANTDAIYDWNLATNELYWGEGLYMLLGYQPHELQMEQWSAAIHPDDREQTIVNLAAVIKDKQVTIWKAEYRIRKKDGAYCHVFERGSIVRDEKGNALHMVGILQDISDRKRAEAERLAYEKAIQQQNQQLVSVLERMNQGFISLDSHLRVRYFNRRAEEIIGVQRSEVLNKVLLNGYCKEAQQLYTPLFKKVLQEQQPLHSEHLCPQNGKWVEVDVYPSEEGISVFFRDIDKRKKTEEELRTLSIIARETASSIITADKDQKITWVNNAFTRMTGYSLAEAIGKKPAELLCGPETSAETLRYMQERQQKGQSCPMEILNYRKNGETFWAEVYWQPIVDADGQIQQYFSIGTDITERKRGEDKLRKLSLIAQQTDNVVILTNREGYITWVNNAFTNVTGYRFEEACGQKPGDLLQGPESDPETIRLMHEQLQNRESFSVEILNYTKSKKQYWLEIFCQPLFDDKGEVDRFFAIGTDVTERRRMQQVLEEERKKRQQMITAAAIAAQEKERAQVGRELHDNVNQVLTTVKLYQELCLSGIGSPQELMRKSMDLLQCSINEIRSLSKRLSAPTLGNIKLKESVKELVDTITATNKISISLSTTGIEGLEVNQELHLALYRILQEHLTNVLKHAEATAVQVLLTIVDSELTLKVSDDGKGFDTRAKRSGIGIANMTTRAESVRGRLMLNSAPGVGCVLLVQIPLE